MKRYCFLRHGQSEANRDAWLAGHRDSPLTELGREQARARQLQLAHQPVDLVLVSDLQRALETARLVLGARELPLRVTPLLRERSGGEWEGASVTKLRGAGHLTRIRHWYKRPPAGESLSDVARRALLFLADNEAAGEDVLVVAHGALISAVLHAFDRGPGGELSSWRPQNAELAERVVAPGTWRQLLERCEEHARRYDRSPGG